MNPKYQNTKRLKGSCKKDNKHISLIDFILKRDLELRFRSQVFQLILCVLLVDEQL